MNSDAFKHFDAETRKALQRTEAALEELKNKRGETAAVLRKSSRKLVKKLRSELKQMLKEYEKPAEPDAAVAIETPKKPTAAKTKSLLKPRTKAAINRTPVSED